MRQPHLIIFAGCNGSGKSTFSNSLVEDGVIPFDYDKCFLENYNSLRDSELKDNFAKDLTDKQLQNLINVAFDALLSFSFETNLHIFPHQIIIRARNLGYIIDVFFFCLENLKIANERVEIRTKNKGHFVSNETIEYKWKEGYKNLNLHYQLFDNLVFIDNSKENKTPQIIFEMNKVDDSEFILTLITDIIPEYTKRRFPAIFNLIDE